MWGDDYFGWDELGLSKRMKVIALILLGFIMTGLYAYFWRW